MRKEQRFARDGKCEIWYNKGLDCSVYAFGPATAATTAGTSTTGVATAFLSAPPRLSIETASQLQIRFARLESNRASTAASYEVTRRRNCALVVVDESDSLQCLCRGVRKVLSTTRVNLLHAREDGRGVRTQAKSKYWRTKEGQFITLRRCEGENARFGAEPATLSS